MDHPRFSGLDYDSNCELLYDVQEPSLSSLDESSTCSKEVAVKQDSYSDGEALRSLMTSTPHRLTSSRRSVSLVDVSKIDPFSRPLGNTLASWETVGSQSSVGKSRDSGYVHSGSLLSVNSGKLSEVKESSCEVSTILEECSRLKRELEYSEVLINTLQESNNDLRMKCAAAHNRISEMRLKCSKHCECCTKQYSRKSNSFVSNSIFLPSSDSSSTSDSSRSPSPDSRHRRSLHSSIASRHSHKSVLTLRSQNDTSSDESSDSPGRVWPIVRNSTAPAGQSLFKDRKITHETIPFKYPTKNWAQVKQSSSKPGFSSPKSTNIVRSLTGDCYARRNHKSETKINKNTIRAPCDNHSFSKIRQNTIEEKETNNVSSSTNSQTQTVEAVRAESSVERYQLSKARFCSIEDLVVSIVKEKESEMLEDKPVFLANELNGKICVGNFQVWGDSSVRVSPKSEVRSPEGNAEASTAYENPNILQIKCDGARLNISGYTDVKYRVPIHSNATDNRSRHTAVHSFPNSPISKRMSLSSHCLYVRPKVSSSLATQNSITKVTPHRVSHQPDAKRTTQDCDTPKSSCLTHKDLNRSFDSATKLKVSKMNASNNNENICQDNLSNLGITISKKEVKATSPDSFVTSSLKTIKSTLVRSPLSYLLSGGGDRVSSKPLGSTSEERNTHPENNFKTHGDFESLSPTASLQDDSTLRNPENSQECMEKAIELAEKLSRGLALLPDRFKHIQNIGSKA